MNSEQHQRLCLIFLFHAILILGFAAVPVGADENAQRNKIKSKISLIQAYLKSRTASQIVESESAEANDLLIRTRELVERAISDFSEDRLEQAQAGIDQSIKLFTAASESIKRRQKSHQQQLIEIESVRAEIDAYLESYQAALVAKNSSTSGPLDQARLAGMLVNAEDLKSKGDIESARALLIETKDQVVAALVDIRSNQTLVYRVEFETPADEFRYEQNRYHEYVALGENVLANGDFDKSRITLFKKLNDAGDRLSREAIAWVEEGDYTSAIHNMRVATKKVVQGLQLLGVPLSMQ